MKNYLALWTLAYYTILGLAICLLMGCASEAELQMAYDSQVEVVKAQVSQSQQKSLVVDCRQGCGKALVEFTHSADMNKVSVPHITNSNDALIGTLPSAMRMFTWAAAAWATTDIINSITDNAGNGNTHTTINQKSEGGSSSSVDLSKTESKVGDNINTDVANDKSQFSDSNDSSTLDSNDDNSQFSDSRVDDNSDNRTDNTADNRIDNNSDNRFNYDNATAQPTVVLPSYPPITQEP